MLFSGLPPSGLPGWFHHPCLGMARAGPSRSIGPLPGGSMGSYQKLMTAFTMRSCWVLHLRHVALGSVFSFALSALKSSPVLPSGKDNSGSGTLTSRQWPEPARHGASAPCLG